METYYALNTGERIDPRDVAGTGQFMNEEDGVLVLARYHRNSGKVSPSPIALTGHRQDTVRTGTVVTLVADQSGVTMGEYAVLGSRSWDGRTNGDLGKRPMNHYVMK